MRQRLQEFVPPVYRFALRLTGDRDAAEDLTQETLLRAWRHRERLDDPEHARIWLFRVAINLHRDGLRRKRARARLRITRPLDAPAPEAACRRAEDVDMALAALDRLPDRQREVLFLDACEGCTIAQIATILDISRSAVKASLSLARLRLRAELAPESNDTRMNSIDA